MRHTKKLLGLVLVLIMSNCSNYQITPCDYDQKKITIAMNTIWGVYMSGPIQRYVLGPPSVVYVVPNCDVSNPGFLDYQSSDCLSGEFITGDNLINVVCTGPVIDDYTLDTLAHETYHYYSLQVFGNSDANHTQPAWQAGGIKDQASAKARQVLNDLP